MRIGVIGAGSIGRRHIGNLLALGCTVAVCDHSESARAKVKADYPVAAVSDTLIFEGLDALVIASPYDFHLPWVEEAIRRNLPFFVEKPLGSLEQLPRWREIAAMDLTVNQVGYNWRFNVKLLRLKKRVRKPTTVAVFTRTKMETWPGASYGAPLLECSHDVDLIQWWLGAMPAMDHSEHGRDDALIVFEGGHQAAISWNAQPDKTWTKCVTAAYPSKKWTAWSSIPPGDESISQSYIDEIAHFIECVREQKPTLCPLADGLKVLEVCRQVEAMA